MDAAPPPALVVKVDDEEKKHLENLAQNVTLATDQKTGVPEIKPIIEQHPLTEETQKEAEEFHQDQQDDSGEKVSKLSYIIPALQKKVRTTQAANFLGKKMEWLSKKTGGDVTLK